MSTLAENAFLIAMFMLAVPTVVLSAAAIMEIWWAFRGFLKRECGYDNERQ